MYQRSCVFAVIGFVVTSLSAIGAEETANTTRMVSIEVIIAEFIVAPQGREAGKIDRAENAAERLKQLEKQGQLGAVVRMQLSTVEGTQASVQIGERSGVATGRTFAFPGGGRQDRPAGSLGTTSYSMQSFGTMVTVTPTIQADGSVVMSLTAERTRLLPTAPPAAGANSAAGGANSGDDAPAKTSTVSTKTTIRIPAGQTILVAGSQNEGHAESGELLILASAKVSDAGKANPK